MQLQRFMSGSSAWRGCRASRTAWQGNGQIRWGSGSRKAAAALPAQPHRAPETALARRSPPPACPLCCLSVCKALKVLLRRGSAAVSPILPATPLPASWHSCNRYKVPRRGRAHVQGVFPFILHPPDSRFEPLRCPRCSQLICGPDSSGKTAAWGLGATVPAARHHRPPTRLPAVGHGSWLIGRNRLQVRAAVDSAWHGTELQLQICDEDAGQADAQMRTPCCKRRTTDGAARAARSGPRSLCCCAQLILASFTGMMLAKFVRRSGRKGWKPGATGQWPSACSIECRPQETGGAGVTATQQQAGSQRNSKMNNSTLYHWFI